MKFLFILIQVLCLRIAINIAYDLQPRIINGDPARIGQFPYFAFLLIEGKTENNVTGCGATLISDQWLLTAAHCVANFDRLVAMLGTSRLDSSYQASIRKKIPIGKDNFHIYPRYFKWTNWNDIALIRLPQKISITENVRPVQMPSNCDSVENIKALVVGHGGTGGEHKISLQLQFATLKTVPLKKCRKTYPFLLFRKSVICALNDELGQSTYDGDSGGPLVSLNGTLIGVTSFRGQKLFGASNDVFTEIPQGFTNIYSYLNWIGEITGMNLPKC